MDQGGANPASAQTRTMTSKKSLPKLMESRIKIYVDFFLILVKKVYI